MGLTLQNGRSFSLREMAFSRIGFLLLQLCFLHLVTSCPVLPDPYGNITKDQELEVGSSFLVQCHIFSNISRNLSLTSSDLILKLGNEILEDVRIIDDLTLEYFVSHATINDTGYYSCFLEKREQKNLLVCSSYVAVGYKPKEVENFSCISSDYTNLTCLWDVPFNPVDTKYELFDYLKDNERWIRKCPIQRNSSCEFRLDTKPPYILPLAHSPDTLKFILNITNSLGAVKQYLKVDHLENVKPGLPRYVMFSNVTQSSLVLRASSSKGLEHFQLGLVYSIKYYSVSTKLHGYKTKIVQSKRDILLQIDDLVPHTQYNFEIKFKLNITGYRFYWSDVFNATESTRSDVPYLAPETINSAFDEQTMAGNRTINIYWKAVPSEFENGDDFHYMIRYHEHYIPTRTSREVSNSASRFVTTEKTTYSFSKMDTETAYMFNVIAVNSIGNSYNQTTVVIDKSERLLRGPKGISVVSYLQNYSISWEMDQDADITHYTIYWCQSLESRPSKCEGPIGWLHTTNTSYNLPLLSYDSKYQFAVAANHNQQTSGMVWAPCVALYDAPYEVKDPNIQPKNATSLKIKWSLGCEAEKKVIQVYEIHYCAYEGRCVLYNAWDCKVDGLGYADWPYVRILNTSVNEYILGHLHPFTCYFVYIRTLTPNDGNKKGILTFGSTMPSAPSDPPNDVKATAMGTSIRVSFDPPKIPNGNISRYVIFYNKMSPESDSYEVEVRVSNMVGTEVEIQKSVFYYTNYSIEVVACVDQACSQRSQPVFVNTGISSPSGLSMPRTEILDSHVNITWDDPPFPNGPVDFYQIKIQNNETETNLLLNISSQHYFMFDRNCVSEPSNVFYYFSVRAVNFNDGVPLYGEYSEPARTIICPTGSASVFIVGVICGAAIGITLLIFLTYKFTQWFINYAKDAKSQKIQLPKGLESPLDNPLAYDKFKSGLQNDHDAGIPYERPYDRLCSFASEGDLVNTPNGTILTQENKQRSSSHRNNSGESSTSNKCHDSISSANTTKTHVSMDSGAEVESPPSPDGFFSDSSSTNTTPYSKPDLNPIDGLNSKDSGLETCPKFACSTFDSKSVWWYAKNKPKPFPLIPFQFGDQLPAYSKFAVDQSFVPKVEQSRGFVEKMSLSNSEPSVADFDDDVGLEPMAMGGMPPYSKFGLARSASNGLNSEGRYPVDNNAGYSKFGIMYHPLKTYPKMVPQNHETFTALTYHNPHPGILCLKSFSGKDSLPIMKKGSPKREMAKKESPRKIDAPGGAYSKFGVTNPAVGWIGYQKSSADVTKPNNYVTYQGAQEMKGDCSSSPLVSDSPDHSSDSDTMEVEVDTGLMSPDVKDIIVDDVKLEIDEVGLQINSDVNTVDKDNVQADMLVSLYEPFTATTNDNTSTANGDSSGTLLSLFNCTDDELDVDVDTRTDYSAQSPSKSPEQRISNGYVPLTDLTRDSSMSSHVIIQPHLDSVNVESV